MDASLINDQEKDLLSKMLEKNPQNRFSAEKCLEHPFFNQEEMIDNKFNSEDFNEIESEFDVAQKNNI
jgi:serine/threonine protein kinase